MYKRCNLIFNTKRELLDHNHLYHPIEKGSSWNKGLTKDTDDRVLKGSNTFKENLKSGKTIHGWVGKHISSKIRNKISSSMKKAIREGRAHGWMSRNIISYPEQFWINVLNNNNIKFEHNFPISRKQLGLETRTNISYFLDFKLPYKIDLEIDGRQHHDLERIESDKERDKLLKANGWKIYRIEWNEINSEFGKKQMQEKIQQFLNWYNINASLTLI